MQERAREVNRVQGVRERANIKLASVVSDIMGVSGRAMIEALRAGKADPAAMAALAKRRMWSKLLLLEQALTGRIRNSKALLRRRARVLQRLPPVATAR